MEWIIQDMNYGKISETNVNCAALEEFVKNYVLNHNNSGYLLQNLSNLYVIRAIKGSDSYSKEGEKNWSDILNRNQYDLLKSNREYIVGLMLVSKPTETLHRIEFIDTRVPKLHLAKHLMNLYQKHSVDNDCELFFPGEIIDTAKLYWKQYLYENHHIEHKDQLDSFRKSESIEKFTDWTVLEDLYN